MNKIIERWYIGLIILPIIINLITEYLNLPILLKNWNFTIIGTFLIVFSILIYELIKVKKENIKLKELPKESDKEIINELLKTIDINEFQINIVDQSCWYGYRKDSIKKIHKFLRKTHLLKYKTADENINNYLKTFANALNEFSSLSATILYADDEIMYERDKNNQVEYEKAKKTYPKVDELSHKAFKILEEMMIYLKAKNYLE